MPGVIDIHIEYADIDALPSVLAHVPTGLSFGMNVKEALIGGNLLRYTNVELIESGIEPAEAALADPLGNDTDLDEDEGEDEI